MRNKYPGTCYRCGKRVEAGQGHFEKIPSGGCAGIRQEATIRALSHSEVAGRTGGAVMNDTDRKIAFATVFNFVTAAILICIALFVGCIAINNKIESVSARVYATETAIQELYEISIPAIESVKPNVKDVSEARAEMDKLRQEFGEWRGLYRQLFERAQQDYIESRGG